MAVSDWHLAVTRMGQQRKDVQHSAVRLTVARQDVYRLVAGLETAQPALSNSFPEQPARNARPASLRYGREHHLNHRCHEVATAAPATTAPL